MNQLNIGPNASTRAPCNMSPAPPSPLLLCHGATDGQSESNARFEALSVH